MNFSILEAVKSREVTTGRTPSVRLQYRIIGTPEAGDHLLDLDEEAREAFDDYVYDEDLDAYDTLEQSRTTVEPVYVHEIGAAEASAGKGSFLWDATIEYTDPERTRPQIDVPQTGESVFSFDISAGTQHRTYSRSTRAHHYRSGFPSTDYSSGIGWDGERFTGVDVYVPTYSFAETHYLANATVTSAYKKKLFQRVGTVNNAAFKGFAQGEVLFLGAAGTRRSGDDWEIQFRFAASPNRETFSVGDISVALVRGWEYMWVEYTKISDGGLILSVPGAVHIEVIYAEADFADIGI